MDDDLRGFPTRGGHPTIFLIACDHEEQGAWRGRVFTADALTAKAEARLMDAWLAHVGSVSDRAGVETRLVTGSVAEQASFELAYDSARRYHPDRGRPALPWLDALRRFVSPSPFTCPRSTARSPRRASCRAGSTWRPTTAATRWPPPSPPARRRGCEG